MDRDRACSLPSSSFSLFNDAVPMARVRSSSWQVFLFWPVYQNHGLTYGSSDLPEAPNTQTSLCALEPQWR